MNSLKMFSTTNLYIVIKLIQIVLATCGPPKYASVYAINFDAFICTFCKS